MNVVRVYFYQLVRVAESLTESYAGGCTWQRVDHSVETHYPCSCRIPASSPVSLYLSFRAFAPHPGLDFRRFDSEGLLSSFIRGTCQWYDPGWE